MKTLTASQLQQAAEVVGTPLYAYSAAALRHRANQLRTFIPGAGFVYSLKANPNKSIVEVLANQGIGAEVCSLFELETALAAGVAPRNIIFVGPAKSDGDLRRAVQCGLKAIIAESLQELDMIEDIAKAAGKVPNVALRINPTFHTKGARLSMSGKPTQFGIDAADADTAIARVEGSVHMHLAGIHVYMGTRILDHNVVLENTRNILELAHDLITQLGRSFDFVDIGGGFGVPYSAAEPTLDLQALSKGVSELIGAFKAKQSQTKVLIELGRYMVAEAGVFLTRVQYVKESKGQKFAVCDGGSNQHAAAAQAASFKRNFPIYPVVPNDTGKEPWNISGPLCTPTDLIGQGVEMAALKTGDLIRVDNSGAYGLTFSPCQFLSFPSPAEVLVENDHLRLIRKPGTVDQHLAQQQAETIWRKTQPTRELELADF
ncbi:MAG: diaminopimelate decarboxylase [Sulfitobacter sp.]